MPRRKYPWLPYKYERMLREAERRYEDGLIDAHDVMCVERYISSQLSKEIKQTEQEELKFSESTRTNEPAQS